MRGTPPTTPACCPSWAVDNLFSQGLVKMVYVRPRHWPWALTCLGHRRHRIADEGAERIGASPPPASLRSCQDARDAEASTRGARRVVPTAGCGPEGSRRSRPTYLSADLCIHVPTYNMVVNLLVACLNAHADPGKVWSPRSHSRLTPAVAQLATRLTELDVRRGRR